MQNSKLGGIMAIPYLVLGMAAGFVINGWPGAITGLMNYSVWWCVVWALADAAWEVRKERRLFRAATPHIYVKAMRAFGFHGYRQKAIRFVLFNLAAFYVVRGIAHLF